MPVWTYADGTRKAVTDDEYDRLEDLQREAYEAAVARITEKYRKEYEADFSEAYRAKRPFSANRIAIHAEACQEIGIRFTA